MRTANLPPPTTRDGRNVDPARAELRGEGAPIEIEAPADAWPVPPEAHPHPDVVPSQTYYDLPAVKAAPWRWYIPAYFYVGGVSGAAATLAGAAALAGQHRTARRMHWLATIGHAASAGLLVADLGRPARFHHMLRGFRPRSPMSVGSWILSAAGASGGLALVRPSRFAHVASACTGALLSTYTGVLIGNTAIPVWRSARNRLPLWFAAASAAGLASLLELGGAPMPPFYAPIAKAANIAGSFAVERVAREVGAPLRGGRSGRLWRTSKWLAIASLAATLVPGARRIAGALGTVSAVLARVAIADAGRASAMDPRATFEPQRR